MIMYEPLSDDQRKRQTLFFQLWLTDIKRFATLSSALLPSQQLALSNLQKPLSSSELEVAIRRAKHPKDDGEPA